MKTIITETRRGKVVFRAVEPRQMNTREVKGMLKDWAVTEHDDLIIQTV